MEEDSEKNCNSCEFVPIQNLDDSSKASENRDFIENMVFSNETIRDANILLIDGNDSVYEFQDFDRAIFISPEEAEMLSRRSGSSETNNLNQESNLTQESNQPPSENLESNCSTDQLNTSKKRLRSRNKEENYFSKYKLLPPCQETCRNKCNKKIRPEYRQAIFDGFWGKNFSERRLYFDGHIVQQDVKRRKSNDDKHPYKRNSSLIYTLPQENGTNVKVCKTMFLHTHGLKTDGMVTDHLRSKQENCGLVVTDDGRGKKLWCQSIDEGRIKNHINSYHPQVSHYRQINSPNRRYLPCDLTITSMWKDYLEKNNQHKVSYETYRKAFEEENIGFSTPNADECQLCRKYDSHNCMKNNTDEMNSNHAEIICEICRDHELHKKYYTEAREAYCRDKAENWDSNVEICAVDMQKVLIIPKMTTKNSFFVSRLIAMNETFASLKKNGQNVCVLWHEAIAGRSAKEVASAYLKFMT